VEFDEGFQSTIEYLTSSGITDKELYDLAGEEN